MLSQRVCLVTCLLICYGSWISCQDSTNSSPTVQSSMQSTTTGAGDTSSASQLQSASTTSSSEISSTVLMTTQTEPTTTLSSSETATSTTDSNGGSSSGAAENATTTVIATTIAITASDAITTTNAINVSTVSDAATNVTESIPATTATDAPAASLQICGAPAAEGFSPTSPCSSSNHVALKRSPIHAPGKCVINNAMFNGSWFRLEGDDGCETFDLMPSDQKCYKSGAYGVNYPQYLSNGTLPGQGLQSNLSFCTTEYTIAERNLCCHYKQPISVMNCQTFYVYSLSEQPDVCGHAFSSPGGPDSQANVDQRQLIEDGTIVKTADILPEDQKQEIATVTFKVHDWPQFKRIQNLEDDLNYALITELEDYYYQSKPPGSTRKRRQADRLNVFILYGFPTYDMVNNEAQYDLIVVNEQDNSPIPAEDIKTVLCGVKLDSVPADVASLVTQTSKPATAPSKADDNLWIAIVIIVGVVASIVIVTLLALCCCILCRRRRTGRMDVSNTKTLLVGEERYTPENGVDNLAMVEEMDKNQNGKVAEPEPEIKQKTAEEAV